MKKICLYRKENGNENLQGRYDNVEEAQDTVKKLTEDEGNGSIFDYFYKEEDYEEITDRVKTYEDEWTVLSLPVIETGEDGKEHALWEFKHTLQELYNLREKNVYVFDTQYMQNPTPLTGLMYEREFKTYEVQPVTRKRKIKAYIDTADTGADFLCCIIYLETEIGNFIIDVYYTQAAMETTEPETARRLTKYKVEEAIIESNNGGRGFSRNVEAQCRILGNRETSFTWFHQSENKEVRIFNHSAEVQNLTYFPKGWEHLFPQFYKAITQYKKTGKNAHDDAPDALTGTIEKRGSQPQKLNRIFR